jgi:glycosyltransferase involved in cell wall biosynthesis
MPNQMAILLIADRLERGESGEMLVKLAVHLREGPFRPLVGCLDKAGSLAAKAEELDIPVYANLLRHKLDVGILLRLRYIIRKECVGVIIAVGASGGRMFWSTLAARWSRIKMVVWSDFFPDAAHQEMGMANRLLCGQVTRFVAQSARHRQALIEFETVPEASITVMPLGIDVDEFDRPDRRRACREALGLNEGHVAVAVIAKLCDDERHDLFIQAAQILTRRHPEARFYLVGDGPRRGHVRRLAQASELLGKSIFLLGAREDLTDLMQAFDIVCSCSERQDRLPITMLEAMAAGKAFVGSYVGSPYEAVIEGWTGRLLPELSVDGLVDVLGELLEDTAQRVSLGRSGLEHVRERFTVDQMARRFEDLILTHCYPPRPP